MVYKAKRPEGQKAKRPEGQKARRPEGQKARFLPSSDVAGHDEHYAGPDESKLDDERVQVWRRLCHQPAQDVQLEVLAGLLFLLGQLDAVKKGVAGALDGHLALEMFN